MRVTDAVLATIDSALEDYATSRDAMRWTTTPPAPAIRPPMTFALRVDTAALATALAGAFLQLTKAVGATGRAMRAMGSTGRPAPPSRTESARARRVETMMRRRDRRAARRRMVRV